MLSNFFRKRQVCTSEKPTKGYLKQTGNEGNNEPIVETVVVNSTVEDEERGEKDYPDDYIFKVNVTHAKKKASNNPTELYFNQLKPVYNKKRNYNNHNTDEFLKTEMMKIMQKHPIEKITALNSRLKNEGLHKGTNSINPLEFSRENSLEMENDYKNAKYELYKQKLSQLSRTLDEIFRLERHLKHLTSRSLPSEWYHHSADLQRSEISASQEKIKEMKEMIRNENSLERFISGYSETIPNTFKQIPQYSEMNFESTTSLDDLLATVPGITCRSTTDYFDSINSMELDEIPFSINEKTNKNIFPKKKTLQKTKHHKHKSSQSRVKKNRSKKETTANYEADSVSLEIKKTELELENTENKLNDETKEKAEIEPELTTEIEELQEISTKIEEAINNDKKELETTENVVEELKTISEQLHDTATVGIDTKDSEEIEDIKKNTCIESTTTSTDQKEETVPTTEEKEVDTNQEECPKCTENPTTENYDDNECITSIYMTDDTDEQHYIDRLVKREEPNLNFEDFSDLEEDRVKQSTPSIWDDFQDLVSFGTEQNEEHPNVEKKETIEAIETSYEDSVPSLNTKNELSSNDKNILSEGLTSILQHENWLWDQFKRSNIKKIIDDNIDSKTFKKIDILSNLDESITEESSTTTEAVIEDIFDETYKFSANPCEGKDDNNEDSEIWKDFNWTLHQIDNYEITTEQSKITTEDWMEYELPLRKTLLKQIAVSNASEPSEEYKVGKNETWLDLNESLILDDITDSTRSGEHTTKIIEKEFNPEDMLSKTYILKDDEVQTTTDLWDSFQFPPPRIRSSDTSSTENPDLYYPNWIGNFDLVKKKTPIKEYLNVQPAYANKINDPIDLSSPEFDKDKIEISPDSFDIFEAHQRIKSSERLDDKDIPTSLESSNPFPNDDEFYKLSKISERKLTTIFWEGFKWPEHQTYNYEDTKSKFSTDTNLADLKAEKKSTEIWEGFKWPEHKNFEYGSKKTEKGDSIKSLSINKNEEDVLKMAGKEATTAIWEGFKWPEHKSFDYGKTNSGSITSNQNDKSIFSSKESWSLSGGKEEISKSDEKRSTAIWEGFKWPEHKNFNYEKIKADIVTQPTYENSVINPELDINFETSITREGYKKSNIAHKKTELKSWDVSHRLDTEYLNLADLELRKKGPTVDVEVTTALWEGFKWPEHRTFEYGETKTESASLEADNNFLNLVKDSHSLSVAENEELLKLDWEKPTTAIWEGFKWPEHRTFNYGKNRLSSFSKEDSEGSATDIWEVFNYGNKIKLSTESADSFLMKNSNLSLSIDEDEKELLKLKETEPTTAIWEGFKWPEHRIYNYGKTNSDETETLESLEEALYTTENEKPFWGNRKHKKPKLHKITTTDKFPTKITVPTKSTTIGEKIELLEDKFTDHEENGPIKVNLDNTYPTPVKESEDDENLWDFKVFNEEESATFHRKTKKPTMKKTTLFSFQSYGTTSDDWFEFNEDLGDQFTTEVPIDGSTKKSTMYVIMTTPPESFPSLEREEETDENHLLPPIAPPGAVESTSEFDETEEEETVPNAPPFDAKRTTAAELGQVEDIETVTFRGAETFPSETESVTSLEALKANEMNLEEVTFGPLQNTFLPLTGTSSIETTSKPSPVEIKVHMPNEEVQEITTEKHMPITLPETGVSGKDEENLIYVLTGTQPTKTEPTTETSRATRTTAKKKTTRIIEGRMTLTPNVQITSTVVPSFKKNGSSDRKETIPASLTGTLNEDMQHESADFPGKVEENMKHYTTYNPYSAKLIFSEEAELTSENGAEIGSIPQTITAEIEGEAIPKAVKEIMEIEMELEETAKTPENLEELKVETTESLITSLAVTTLEEILKPLLTLELEITSAAEPEDISVLGIEGHESSITFETSTEEVTPLPDLLTPIPTMSHLTTYLTTYVSENIEDLTLKTAESSQSVEDFNTTMNFEEYSAMLTEMKYDLKDKLKYTTSKIEKGSVETVEDLSNVESVIESLGNVTTPNLLTPMLAVGEETTVSSSSTEKLITLEPPSKTKIENPPSKGETLSEVEFDRNMLHFSKTAETSTICEICDETETAEITSLKTSGEASKAPKVADIKSQEEEFDSNLLHFSGMPHETSTLCEICDWAETASPKTQETVSASPKAHETISASSKAHEIVSESSKAYETASASSEAHETVSESSKAHVLETSDKTMKEEEEFDSNLFHVSGIGHESSTICEICDTDLSSVTSSPETTIGVQLVSKVTEETPRESSKPFAEPHEDEEEFEDNLLHVAELGQETSTICEICHKEYVEEPSTINYKFKGIEVEQTIPSTVEVLKMTPSALTGSEETVEISNSVPMIATTSKTDFSTQTKQAQVFHEDTTKAVENATKDILKDQEEFELNMLNMPKQSFETSTICEICEETQNLATSRVTPSHLQKTTSIGKVAEEDKMSHTSYKELLEEEFEKNMLHLPAKHDHESTICEICDSENIQEATTVSYNFKGIEVNQTIPTTGKILRMHEELRETTPRPRLTTEEASKISISEASETMQKLSTEEQKLQTHNAITLIVTMESEESRTIEKEKEISSTPIYKVKGIEVEQPVPTTSNIMILHETTTGRPEIAAETTVHILPASEETLGTTLVEKLVTLENAAKIPEEISSTALEMGKEMIETTGMVRETSTSSTYGFKGIEVEQPVPTTNRMLQMKEMPQVTEVLETKCTSVTPQIIKETSESFTETLETSGSREEYSETSTSTESYIFEGTEIEQTMPTTKRVIVGIHKKLEETSESPLILEEITEISKSTVHSTGGNTTAEGISSLGPIDKGIEALKQVGEKFEEMLNTLIQEKTTTNKTFILNGIEIEQPIPTTTKILNMKQSIDQEGETVEELTRGHPILEEVSTASLSKGMITTEQIFTTDNGLNAAEHIEKILEGIVKTEKHERDTSSLDLEGHTPTLPLVERTTNEMVSETNFYTSLNLETTSSMVESKITQSVVQETTTLEVAALVNNAKQHEKELMQKSTVIGNTGTEGGEKDTSGTSVPSATDNTPEINAGEKISVVVEFTISPTGSETTSKEVEEETTQTNFYTSVGLKSEEHPESTSRISSTPLSEEEDARTNFYTKDFSLTETTKTGDEERTPNAEEHLESTSKIKSTPSSELIEGTQVLEEEVARTNFYTTDLSITETTKERHEESTTVEHMSSATSNEEEIASQTNFYTVGIDRETAEEFSASTETSGVSTISSKENLLKEIPVTVPSGDSKEIVSSSQKNEKTEETILPNELVEKFKKIDDMMNELLTSTLPSRQEVDKENIENDQIKTNELERELNKLQEVVSNMLSTTLEAEELLGTPYRTDETITVQNNLEVSESSSSGTKELTTGYPTDISSTEEKEVVTEEPFLPSKLEQKLGEIDHIIGELLTSTLPSKEIALSEEEDEKKKKLENELKKVQGEVREMLNTTLAAEDILEISLNTEAIETSSTATAVVSIEKTVETLKIPTSTETTTGGTITQIKEFTVKEVPVTQFTTDHTSTSAKKKVLPNKLEEKFKEIDDMVNDLLTSTVTSKEDMAHEKEEDELEKKLEVLQEEVEEMLSTATAEDLIETTLRAEETVSTSPKAHEPVSQKHMPPKATENSILESSDKTKKEEEEFDSNLFHVSGIGHESSTICEICDVDLSSVTSSPETTIGVQLVSNVTEESPPETSKPSAKPPKEGEDVQRLSTAASEDLIETTLISEETTTSEVSLESDKQTPIVSLVAEKITTGYSTLEVLVTESSEEQSTENLSTEITILPDKVVEKLEKIDDIVNAILTSTLPPGENISSGKVKEFDTEKLEKELEEVQEELKKIPSSPSIIHLLTSALPEVSETPTTEAALEISSEETTEAVEVEEQEAENEKSTTAAPSTKSKISEERTSKTQSTTEKFSKFPLLTTLLLSLVTSTTQHYDEHKTMTGEYGIVSHGPENVPKCLIVYLTGENQNNSKLLELNGTKWVPSESALSVASSTIEFTTSASSTEVETTKVFETTKQMITTETIEESFRENSNFVENGCTEQEFLNNNNCFCMLDLTVDSAADNWKDTTSSKTSIKCSSFLKINRGLLINNNSQPISKRTKRSYLYLKYLNRQKRELVEYNKIDEVLSNELTTQDTDDTIYADLESTALIPCVEKGEIVEREHFMKYIWTTAGDKLIMFSDRIKEATDGSLKISDIKIEDGGNYTCTISRPFGNTDSEHKHFIHELLIITRPIFKVKSTIMYDTEEPCSLKDGDIIQAYLPNLLEDLICGLHKHVCRVELERPSCVEMDEKTYLTMKYIVTLDSFELLLPSLTNSECNFDCQMKILGSLMSLLIKNVETTSVLDVISELKSFNRTFKPRQVTFPIDRTNVEDLTLLPKLIIGCPAGFGIKKTTNKVCVACPRNTYSSDNSSSCLPCPPIQYQPKIGSTTCIECKTPFDDKSCIGMMLANKSFFIIYIGSSIAIIFFILLCIFCAQSGVGPSTKKRKYQSSKKRRIGRKDVEDPAEKPLLAKDPSVPRVIKGPKVPPPDF